MTALATVAKAYAGTNVVCRREILDALGEAGFKIPATLRQRYVCRDEDITGNAYSRSRDGDRAYKRNDFRLARDLDRAASRAVKKNT